MPHSKRTHVLAGIVAEACLPDPCELWASAERQQSVSANQMAACACGSNEYTAAPDKVPCQPRQRRQQQHTPCAVLALELSAKACQHQAVGDEVHSVLVQEDGGQPALRAARMAAGRGGADWSETQQVEGSEWHSRA